MTARCIGSSVNVAVTPRAALIVTVHVRGAGAGAAPARERRARRGPAVSVTVVPLAKSFSQVAPQAMPAGLLVTEPLPVPAFVTVRWNVWA